jgi:hypothetical protein
MDVNKAIQKIFSKIKDNNNRYKAKSSVVSLVIFNYNSFNSCFSDKLELKTAFRLQVPVLLQVIASFAGWLAIMFGGFTIREIAFNLAELRAMWI